MSFWSMKPKPAGTLWCAKYPRRCVALSGAAAGQTGDLHTLARNFQDLGTRTLKLAATPRRQARETLVRVAAGRLQVAAPRYPRGQHSQAPLPLQVVHVRELAPPAGEKPVEWFLLTDQPVATAQEAWRVVDYYAARWIIEEYHKGQKTGCSIEAPQFTQCQRLEPMIGLLSVVAVQLLRLRDAARQPALAAKPAAEVVPAQWVQVLAAWRWHDPQRQPTVAEFLLALARLGGHQNRKADGPPGWITLWRGWMKLQSMIAGASAMKRRRVRCG